MIAGWTRTCQTRQSAHSNAFSLGHELVFELQLVRDPSDPR